MTFREQIIALDGGRCRNPHCLGGSFSRHQLSVHHIIYKSHGGQDVPENAITLCRDCDFAVHNGHGKGSIRLSGRRFMLSMLEMLLAANLKSGSDYRWMKVHEELRLRYAS